MAYRIEVSNEPTPLGEKISSALTDYNTPIYGPPNRQHIEITVYADDDTLIAGLIGELTWQYLYIRQLWVDAPQRGNGLAGDLLHRAEAVAQSKGCAGAWIDTFSGKVCKIYERAGYCVFGTLPRFANGQDRIFLWKSLEM